MNRYRLSEYGGLVAAAAATTCCILPLIAVVLGLSGAASGLAQLDVLYFPFAGVSLILLAVSGWKNVIRPIRLGQHTDPKQKKRFALMASVILVALTIPWLIPLLQCAECR